MTNQLEQRFNPVGYQWEENGKIVKITEMSRDDLLQVVCSCMNTIEQFDTLFEGASELMDAFRKGRDKELAPLVLTDYRETPAE